MSGQSLQAKAPCGQGGQVSQWGEGRAGESSLGQGGQACQWGEGWAGVPVPALPQQAAPHGWPQSWGCSEALTRKGGARWGRG